jgi:hypothetical protein
MTAAHGSARLWLSLRECGSHRRTRTPFLFHSVPAVRQPPRIAREVCRCVSWSRSVWCPCGLLTVESVSTPRPARCRACLASYRGRLWRVDPAIDPHQRHEVTTVRRLFSLAVALRRRAEAQNGPTEGASSADPAIDAGGPLGSDMVLRYDTWGGQRAGGKRSRIQLVCPAWVSRFKQASREHGGGRHPDPLLFLSRPWQRLFPRSWLETEPEHLIGHKHKESQTNGSAQVDKDSGG